MKKFFYAMVFTSCYCALSVTSAEIVDQRDNLSAINYGCQVEGGERQYVKDGAVCGTTGQSKRLEQLSISLSTGAYNCNLQYRVHVQDMGWTDWAVSGQTIGSYITVSTDDGRSFNTVPTGKRIEAMQINLAACPDVVVSYRAHVQDIGWMDWVGNNEIAGTTGQSLRLEAFQIKMANPQPKYDYQGRIYNFFDGGYLYLPLVEMLTDDDWVTGSRLLARDIQTRLRLVAGWTFELESNWPYVIEGLVPFFSEKPFLNYQANNQGVKGEFVVPTIVVETGDDFQIYDALLQQSATNPKQFELANLVHRQVPFNVESFYACQQEELSDTFYDGDYQLFNAYKLYAFLTGQEMENIPGYALMMCCVHHNFYMSYTVNVE